MTKLLYVLRTLPCFDNSLLASSDDTLRRGLSLVLNVELSDKQWSQANLSVQMGGLGVRSACKLASSAFLASAAATLSLQNVILFEPIKAAEDPAISSATTTWTSLTQSSIPAEVTRHIQKAWDTPVAATVYQTILADDTNTATDIARLKAAATIHAGDWLHAPPIKAVGLRLSDEDIRIAVGFRLGSRTCQPHSCLCSSIVNAQGLHGLSCRKSAPRQIRHVQMNDII